MVTAIYNFPNWYNPSVEGPAYYFTAAEMNYARQAFALWADVANINFVEVSAGDTANIAVRKVYQDPGVAGGTWYPYTIYNGVDTMGSTLAGAFISIPPIRRPCREPTAFSPSCTKSAMRWV